jgi:predicted nucleic acid-binding protein
VCAPTGPANHWQPRLTLSLADALILAVTERLQCAVVTRDRYWAWMAEQGLLAIVVHTF